MLVDEFELSGLDVRAFARVFVLAYTNNIHENIIHDGRHR